MNPKAIKEALCGALIALTLALAPMQQADACTPRGLPWPGRYDHHCAVDGLGGNHGYRPLGVSTRHEARWRIRSNLDQVGLEVRQRGLLFLWRQLGRRNEREGAGRQRSLSHRI